MTVDRNSDAVVILRSFLAYFSVSESVIDNIIQSATEPDNFLYTVETFETMGNDMLSGMAISRWPSFLNGWLASAKHSGSPVGWPFHGMLSAGRGKVRCLK